MYIYTIKDNKAILLGQQGSYDQLIEQETYPARVDHPTHTPFCLTARPGDSLGVYPLHPGGAEGTRLRDGQGHPPRGRDAACGRGESQVAGVSGRGQQQANELTTMIANAKATIREQYPDEG